MKRGPLAAALLCASLGLCWQWLTVHFNYGGNATALFYHGSQFPLPPGLAAEGIYVFPNSGGYDGQSYHYMAHDPLARSDIGRAVPDPSLRYPRILLPGMAYVLALGRPQWIDGSFRICMLFFLGLGAYWLAHLLARMGVHPLFAALYVVVPVAIVSLDRMLVDLPLTSLALGFAVYVDADSGTPWKLYAILSAAALCRDTGVLLSAAYTIRLLSLRRYRQVAICAAAVLPAALWTLWVRTSINGGNAIGPPGPYPFRGIVQAVLHPHSYPFPAPLVAVIRVLGWVQVGGIVLSIVLALRIWRKLGVDAIGNTCFLWACLGLILPYYVYDDPLAGARTLAPLLLFQFLQAGRFARLPLLLVTPRVWLELTPKVLGILRGLV